MTNYENEFYHRFNQRLNTKTTKTLGRLYHELTKQAVPDPEGPDMGYCGDWGAAAGASFAAGLWLVDHAPILLGAIKTAKVKGMLPPIDDVTALAQKVVASVSRELNVPQDEKLNLVSRLFIDLGIELRSEYEDWEAWTAQSTRRIVHLSRQESLSFSGSGQELFILPWAFEIELSPAFLQLDQRLAALRAETNRKIRAGVGVSELELNNWAYALLMIGRWKSATPMAALATEMNHCSRNLDTLGWAHYLEGDVRRSLDSLSEALESALEEGPDAWAETAYHKLCVLIDFGDKATANDLLEAFRTTAPSSQWAKKANDLESLLRPGGKQALSERRKDRQFEYDVAISFAGEDRAHAERLVFELNKRGVRVFYDEFEKADLWGQNLFDHLTQVYEKQATYCIMLISENYARKRWTMLERQAAQARAFMGDTTYILPVRLDSADVPGVLSTVGYLDWQKEGVPGIVDCFLRKLKG